jgi:alanine racemase
MPGRTTSKSDSGSDKIAAEFAIERLSLLSIWLKIDTGMHRLGLSSEEYQQCLSDFNTNPLIHIECILSHFA